MKGFARGLCSWPFFTSQHINANINDLHWWEAFYSKQPRPTIDTCETITFQGYNVCLYHLQKYYVIKIVFVLPFLRQYMHIWIALCFLLSWKDLFVYFYLASEGCFRKDIGAWHIAMFCYSLLLMWPHLVIPFTWNYRVHRLPSFVGQEFEPQYVLIFRFGNFLCNSMRERESRDVVRATVSLWSHLDALKHSLLNNGYTCSYQNVGIILEILESTFQFSRQSMMS